MKSGSGIAALLVVAALAAPNAVRADGAFPDSLAVLLPRDRPRQIIVATNFGLLLSDDEGVSWEFVCEEAIGVLASLYTLGPPPDDRLFAISLDGLLTSSDLACTWRLVQEPIVFASDAFPDPNDPSRVLAIAESGRAANDEQLQGVFESDDGGESFAREPRYVAPAGLSFTGIEIARSDPSVVYGALYAYNAPTGSWLVRSRDAGMSWQRIDLRGELGTKLTRILAVDEADANRVYLRVYDNGPEDALAIYDDATEQLVIALMLSHRMSAFLRRSDGALIVGTREEGAYISTDSGASFQPWPDLANGILAPHLNALGERDGRLYAVADDRLDGYALAISDDRGRTWQPILRLSNVDGPRQCGQIALACQQPWESLQARLAAGAAEQPAFEPDADVVGSTPGALASDGRQEGCGCASVHPSTLQGAWRWFALSAWPLLLVRGMRRARSLVRRSSAI